MNLDNNGLATKVKSKEYIENQKVLNMKPPFYSRQWSTPYKLVVTFPDRDQFVSI